MKIEIKDARATDYFTTGTMRFEFGDDAQWVKIEYPGGTFMAKKEDLTAVLRALECWS